jgi:hypothetical protein
MSNIGSVHAPFGVIHSRNIKNLAVLKWLAENAADHPESVIVHGYSAKQEYPTFNHIPQKFQLVDVKNARVRKIKEKPEVLVDDQIIWVDDHPSVGTRIGKLFGLKKERRLYEGAVTKYGLPSKKGKRDHLYHIRFDDGDECDWGQTAFETSHTTMAHFYDDV